MLNNSQYSTSSNYEARIYLNKTYKTNHYSKYEWLFSFFPKQDKIRILELGCGTGLFWLANRKSINSTWNITLSDYSAGMMGTTKKSLSRLPFQFHYEVVDANNIQYNDNTFDLVLANNMLYHIHDREKTIQKIHDILKPNGLFIASTMGKDDLLDLHKILYRFLETKGNKFKFREFVFSMDNGQEQLEKAFSNIEVVKYMNSLKITDIEPIIAYYHSFNGIYDNLSVLPDEWKDAFRDYLNNIMNERKEIDVRRNEGAFLCRK
jgi:ubiquinone/menaquinone biosynthesis C-methylase UbiE